MRRSRVFRPEVAGLEDRISLSAYRFGSASIYHFDPSVWAYGHFFGQRTTGPGSQVSFRAGGRVQGLGRFTISLVHSEVPFGPSDPDDLLAVGGQGTIVTSRGSIALTYEGYIQTDPDEGRADSFLRCTIHGGTGRFAAARGSLIVSASHGLGSGGAALWLGGGIRRSS
jgi:hypothetical protein